MPIKVTDTLPATGTLNSENIFVMTETRALKQEIRPLEIVILNLMPKKIETETQLLRVLGITGAPVEQMDFEEVDYWDELCEIMEWSKKNVTSTFHICWGAQAGLYYHYGIPKYEMKDKLFGIFEHYVLPEKKHKILLRGFDDKFYAPHSRHTETRESDIVKVPELEILSKSDEAGVYIVSAKSGRQFFVTGHSEYDNITLANEYFRDKAKGIDINLPKNYFPDNDPLKEPLMMWRSHANLLYSNWLNYFVYQTTPYNLDEIQ